MTVPLMEKIKAWWHETERRERHRRMYLYYELGLTNASAMAR